MRPRLFRTLLAVVLLTGVGGVVALATRSHPRGTTLITTGNASSADRAQSIQARADTADLPPTSRPDTVTTAPPTSTSVAAPPTTRARSGTTTTSTAMPTSTTVPTSTAVPPSTTMPPIGPATGRLAVTLALVRANGTGVGGGIATMAADGSDRRVLVAGNYFVPQWTPDGRFVVFSSSDTYGIWAVPANGGPLTHLADDVSGPISPDGTRVVHPVGALGSTVASPLMVQPITETATGPVATGTPISLGVSGFHPIWSPDGHRVLYATQLGPTSDLAVVDTDGGNRHDLLGSGPVQALLIDSPGFSADGSTVSFVGTDNRAYFIGADGQNLRPALPDVIPGISNVSAFSTAWSGDHKKLAVLVDGANSVVVVDTGRRVLASVHLPEQGSPLAIAFDGSGQHIYYMGTPRPGPPLLSNLYSIALDGTRSHQLDTDASILISPTVLP